MKRYLFLLLILPFIVLLSCEDDADCPDCGKLTEGYLFKKVTQDDFAAFAGVSGIEVDACMRYKLTSGDISANTITIVDDCCCE